MVGLCEAAIMTRCTTLIADYWPGPRRSRYLGLQTLLASVSATVFLGLGGVSGSPRRRCRSPGRWAARSTRSR
ncbi:hypothetical protein [Actinoplanes sp. SE50/110]|uniref:hypothetical protein n=1 Tax=unclassified Actinoplanes TaxID=2626549 RepID=UPI0035100C22